MAGLLDGLEKFGIKNADQMKVYEDEKRKKEQAAKMKEAAKPDPEELAKKEKEYLFFKTYDCPVCGTKFKDLTIKASRVRMVGMDRDLRPIHEGIEPLKYEAVVCPQCGHAALARYFGGLASSQVKAIRENISNSYKGHTQKELYSLEEALARSKMCLLNAIVKHAKTSEKAYICLKCGWLVRCMKEKAEADFKEGLISQEAYAKKSKELNEKEQEYLLNAYEGFAEARQTESDYPMCGMDETTVDYLLAALALDIGKYDVANKMIASILGSATATSRIKDKARDMKDELLVLMKNKADK